MPTMIQEPMAQGAPDAAQRAVHVRYLDSLMDKFKSRAKGDEIECLMAVMRYWAAGEASMDDEDRESVELIGTAFIATEAERERIVRAAIAEEEAASFARR